MTQHLFCAKQPLGHLTYIPALPAIIPGSDYYFRFTVETVWRSEKSCSSSKAALWALEQGQTSVC